MRRPPLLLLTMRFKEATVRVIKHGDSYGVHAGYFSPALNAAARSVAGMTWEPVSKTWVGAIDAVELLVAGLTSRGLRLDTSELSFAREPRELMPIAESGLRPYQVEGVRFLLETKRALLADDMGLGKTCTALTAARALASRTLIVTPSYVRGVWFNESTGGELRKWWPGTPALLPKGVSKLLAIHEDEKVVVIHYDILYAWASAICDWAPRVVIFDEVHALMSEGSRRSVAAKEVSQDAEMVWGLSGTPLTNRPRDLWNVVDTLSPGRFGKFFAFGLRYCDAHKEAVTPTKTVWKFDGASNLPELNARLKTLMLRRLKSDVGLQLPPKTRQIVNVEVPAKAQLMPDAGAKAMRLSLDRAADAKIADACSLIGDHVAAGHKVVVFTYRRSVAEHVVEYIRESGFSSGLVHGGVSTLRRDKAVEDAKAAREGHALCCTIDSSSTGIDLSFADVAVFVELTYEPQELLQAEARLHRFGQASPVLIQYVIASGTTDELIAAKVISKLEVYEKTIGSTGESLAGDLEGKAEDILGELYASIEKQKVKRK